MKIRSIIVDDDPDARESVSMICNDFFSDDIEIAGTAASVKEAVKCINILKPDLVFLDVEMPNEPGFQLFEYFGHDALFQVVFITAYEEYALSAFRYAALDYLLKPVDIKQLEETIQRAKKRVENNNRLRIETFIGNLSHDLEIDKKILLPIRNGYHVVKINSIVYCRAEGNYSIVYVKDAKSFLVTSTLKSLEELLPAKLFFRTHRSIVVNLNCIVRYDSNRNILVMDSGVEIEVSERKASSLENTLKNR